MNKVQEILAAPKVHAALGTALIIGQAFVPPQYSNLMLAVAGTLGFSASTLPHQELNSVTVPDRPRARRKKPRAPVPAKK
jgi:hypothetical protein